MLVREFGERLDQDDVALRGEAVLRHVRRMKGAAGVAVMKQMRAAATVASGMVQRGRAGTA